MALDRRAWRGGGPPWGIVVAIVQGSGADSLDALAARYGVLLVRPAVPGRGQRPEPRPAEPGGVAGWHSDAGWVLVGRGASGARPGRSWGRSSGRSNLSRYCSPVSSRRIRPSDCRAAGSCRRLPLTGHVAVAAAGPPGRSPGWLRRAARGNRAGAVLRSRRADSRYAAFLPAGHDRKITIGQIRTKWYLCGSTADRWRSGSRPTCWNAPSP